MSAEHLSKADLRARRQDERRSGRGFPELPAEEAVPEERSAGLNLNNPVTKKRFFQLAPPAALAAALVFAQIREAATIGGFSASELYPTPAEIPTPEGVAEEMIRFEQTIKKINQEPDVATSQATPTATEIQREQQNQLLSEEVEGIKLKEIPFSTASNLYFLPVPITVGQVAEKLEVSEEEFLSHNKFLLKECEADLKYCPYVSFDQRILMGNRFVVLPEEYMDVDKISSIRSNPWPYGVLEKRTEGRVFSVQSNSYSIRAILIGQNIETGNFVVQIGDNDYFEIHQTQFLVDFGFAPERIVDDEFGEGQRWQLENSGQIIYIETYSLPENIAQDVALDIRNYLPLVQKYCVFDVSNIKRIVYTTGVSADVVGAQFAGISCESEGDKCRILIKRGLVSDAPAHELCHAGNNVQLEDGSWTPAYSRIIDEGFAAFVDDIRKAPYRSEQVAHLFGDEEMLEQNNIEELRSEVLLLDFNDEKTLHRYGNLTEYAGWAIWKINQTAVKKDRPEFLVELISAARELVRSEKRRVTGYDLVDLAEKIWPGEGADLINKYNVLFIQASWEK